MLNISFSLWPPKTLLSIFMLAFCCYSCDLVGIDPTKADHLDDISKGYDYVREIQYGKNPALKMDIHLPQTLEGNPAEVVILLHGGGWTSGEKSFLKPSVDQLINQKKNLAIININYHLKADTAVGNLLQTQVADLGDVSAFLRRNAEKYNLRTDNYRLAGISAGGHIALMYAYTSGDAGVGAVMAGSAPTDLAIKETLDRALWSNVEELTGKKYHTAAENIFKNESPLFVVSARSPKTSLVYGLRDFTVAPIQGKLLNDKLKLLGVPSFLAILEQESHNLTPQTFTFYILKTYE